MNFTLIPLRNAVSTLAVAALAMLMSYSSIASANYLEHDDVKQFVLEMVEKHEFSRTELEALFAEAEKKQSILDAIARPAEKRLEWREYRKIFLTHDRIKRGKAFIAEHKEVLERAEKTYGVPKAIIAAIIGVETRYGKNKGGYRVIDSLSTLAFDYPPRSQFFKSELEQMLLLAREQKFNPLELTGSYAGAMGYGQFIPSSYRNFAVDFDGDGVADILNNPVDAIGSVANYFKKHRWLEGEPVTGKARVKGSAYENALYSNLKPKYSLEEMADWGIQSENQYDPKAKAKLIKLEGEKGTEFWVGLHNFYVITRYNHSHLYAMAVYQLSEELK